MMVKKRWWWWWWWSDGGGNNDGDDNDGEVTVMILNVSYNRSFLFVIILFVCVAACYDSVSVTWGDSTDICTTR